MMKFKDFTSLHELPRIFVNVTKAIGMFVDVWLGTNKNVFDFFPLKSSLGREIDPSCLYSPKPSTNNSLLTINDNIPSTPVNHQSSRPAAQSLRGVPTIIQQYQPPPMPATLKTTRSQIDTRKSKSSSFINIRIVFFCFASDQ